MKHKTLFRLLLKFLGVWLFIQGATQLISQAGWVIGSLSSGGGYPDLLTVLLWLLGGAVQCVLALYLFFGGRWIVDKAIPSNRPYCHECGYELTGTVESRCPECATPFRPEDVSADRPPKE
jgi:hypothetical protein